LSAILSAVACAGAVALPAAFAEDRGAQPAPQEEDQYEGQTVQNIDIRGLTRVDEGTVLRLIRTRKGRPFNRKIWDEDFHRLYDSGYFLNVRTTEPQPWPGGVMLAIDLQEKGVISKITFRGSRAVSDAKLLEQMQSHEGGRYDPGEVHKDRAKIEQYYRDHAFRSAKVEYRIETISSHRQLIANKEVDVQDEVLIAFTIDEGSPVGVRVIRFVGNKAFSETALRAVMATKYRRLFRAGDLKDEDLENDKNRIQQFYWQHGYMDAKVEKVDVNVSQETYWNWFRKRKRLAEVIIHVSEGPQYHTGTVTINGNESISKDEIQAVMKIKPGSVYSDFLLLRDDHDRIVDLYGERGRVFTKVFPSSKFVTDPERTKKQPNLYDVTIEIHEGAEVTLREVITRGNVKTRDKVLIRQMELFPGDRIDTTKIKIAIQRLKNLNYFNDDVRITPEATDNPEEANLVIDVTEKNTGEFNFGVGVSSVDSVVGNVKLTQHNFDYRNLPKSWRDLIGGNAFTGAGETASVEASGGKKRQNYLLAFTEPWAFDRPIRLGGSIFRNVDTYQNFNETNTGLNISVGKRLWGPRWDGEIDYRFSITDIGKIGRRYPPLLREQEGQSLLSSITPRLVYDSRDSRLLPSRGFLMQSSIELGGGPLLGDWNYARAELDVAHYLTVFKTAGGGKHILELHGKAGAIESYGSTNEVPPFLRYYAGGIDTIRGFQYRSISPLENNFQIGGKRELLASAEYSLPLYEEVVRGSLFADAGNVFDAGQTDPRTSVTNTGSWRTSIGAGLAIRTPISPLPVRIYFSHPISRTPQDRTKTIDFTFGTRF
jgi:outer membrane protein insertion porin family